MSSLYVKNPSLLLGLMNYMDSSDALPSLCISLSCYRVPSEIPDIRKEIVSSGRTPSIEEIAERYFAGTISWPQDNGLDVAIESDSRAPLSFRISPPFDVCSSSLSFSLHSY